MKQGTISVLFGCHSIIHSAVVILTWKAIHKTWPNYWEFGCILLHDIGHWGKDYLDNYEEKKRHAELGAKVARVLFGEKGFDLVAGHNAYNGQSRSKLYEPDKASWLKAPYWWLMTNEFIEPKLVRPGSTRKESINMFREAIAANARNGYAQQGHEIYLKQRGASHG